MIRIQTLVHWLGHNDAVKDAKKVICCQSKAKSKKEQQQAKSNASYNGREEVASI